MSIPALRIPKRMYSRVPKVSPLARSFPLYSLRFNGSTGRVVIPDDPTLDLTSEFTIMFYFYKKDWTGNFEIFFAKGDNTPVSNYHGGLRDPEHDLYFSWYNAGWRDHFSNTIFELDKCYHIALIWDDPNWYIYVNGALDNQGTDTNPPLANDKDLWLGAYSGYGNWFLGYILNFMIYSRALSLGEICRNMRNPMTPISDGLALWIPMVEGNGTTVEDFSLNTNNGTLVGGVSWYEIALYEALADIL